MYKMSATGESIVRGNIHLLIAAAMIQPEIEEERRRTRPPVRVTLEYIQGATTSGPAGQTVRGK